jgi:hypothetical protein
LTLPGNAGGFSWISEVASTHYLGLEEKPPRYDIPAGVATRQRSIHVRTTTWAAAKAQKVRESRPVSAILEQLLRAYLGFPFASDTDGAEQSL